MEDELTPKEEQFCNEFIVDLNGTQAAIRAGYAPNSANVSASRLLSNANIRSRIDKLKRERTERVLATADDVLFKLHMAATFDPLEFFNEDGSMRQLPDIKPEHRALIEGIKETKFGRELQIMPKLKAIEMLARHLQLFKDRIVIESDLSQQSTEDLAAILADKLKQLGGS